MTNPDQIWSEAVRALEHGKPFAMATVVNVRGSTPREVGAKMIVRDDGQFGTIGGGCGEAEVFRKARVLLEENRAVARLTEVDLTGDFEQQEIGTCGGIMDVFIDIWLPGDDLGLARELAEAAAHNRPAALLTVVDPGSREGVSAGTRAVIESRSAETALPAPLGLPEQAMRRLMELTTDSRPGLLELNASGGLSSVVRMEVSGAPRVFLDPISGAQRLIIVGAGHIAQPLASLGSMLGFHVTVVDDRASFANRERFPTANRILVGRFEQAIDSLGLDRHCYLVSVTRGHAFDEQVVRTALKYPCGYVGMIGSRRRVKATLERIGESDIPADRLDEVHAPLGLDIGAETPAEIAVAIIAEIVRERRTGIRDDLTLGVKRGRLRSSTRLQ